MNGAARRPVRGDRVLVIAPHPDDETIAAGGLIGSAVDAGAGVRLVVVTDGNRRGLGWLRDAELAEAVTALGLEPHSVVRQNHRDGSPGSTLFPELQEEARRFEPTIVVAPHPADRHSDHRLIGRAAEDLDLPASCALYQYLVHFPGFPRPRRLSPRRSLEAPDALGAEADWSALPVPLHLLQRKFRALCAHRSQLMNPWLTRLLLSFVRRNELFRVLAGDQRANRGYETPWYRGGRT